LFRKGVRDEARREALAGLAKLESKNELRVLLDALHSQDEQSAEAEESVAFDLVRLLTSRPTGELTAVRPELEKLATEARRPLIRELGYVVLVAADGGIDKAWSLATKSVTAV